MKKPQTNKGEHKAAHPIRGGVSSVEWIAALSAKIDMAIKRSDNAASTGDVGAEQYHDGYADALVDVCEEMRRAAIGRDQLPPK